MRIYVVFAALLLFSLPVLAEQNKAETLPSADAEAGEEEREPGPVTQDEGKDIALQVIPGTIKDHFKRIEGDLTYYEYLINQDNGNIVRIRINADTGAVHNVDYLKAEGPDTLPEPEFPMEEAKIKALEEVEKRSGKSPGFSKARILSAKYQLYERKPFYVIEAKKVMSEYRILIDPVTGSITSFERYD